MASKEAVRFKILYDWFQNTHEMVNSKSHTQSVINARLRKLEEKYSLLLDRYEELLMVIQDEAVTIGFDTQFKEAEEWYNQLDAISAAYPNLSGVHQPTESAQTPRLPRINLTGFDGDVYSWTSFISLFNSLVMSRKDISKTEKFHYLISNVEKEPRSLIKHLPMVDESLDTAMEILMGRYENKRLLADSHISRLLNLPVLHKSYGLRAKILNPLLESTRALTNLGIPTEQYLLLHITLTKLPIDVKTRFEQRYGGNTSCLPTFSQLTEFLQNECRLLDTATSEQTLSHTYADRVRRPERTVHVVDRGTVSQCLFCQYTGHAIGNCFKFGNLKPEERKQWVGNKGLCFRCFGEHTAASCNRDVACDRCGNSGHNKLICVLNVSKQSATGGYPPTRPSHERVRDSGASGSRNHSVQNYRRRSPTPNNATGGRRYNNGQE